VVVVVVVVVSTNYQQHHVDTLTLKAMLEHQHMQHADTCIRLTSPDQHGSHHYKSIRMKLNCPCIAILPTGVTEANN
jgi:hypothetical protein